MYCSADFGCKEFPMPSVVKTIVCCDLDETYIPFSKECRMHGGVSELEAFLNSRGEDLGVVLGWITGTNLKSALRKAKGYISASPHFVCCCLGTEFYWVKEGKLCSSESWQQRISASGFREAKVVQALAAVKKKT